MEAQTSNNFSYILQISRFDISPEAVYPVFIIGTLIYLFSVLSNVTILALIVMQKKLHKPMFYIMFSLPLADLIGITTAFPRVLVDIITQNNTVYYPTCFLQGILLHTYAGVVLLILAAMSVDRYIAICYPLRYNSIMTSYTVCGILILVWGIDITLILVLFALQARVMKCKNFIFSVYCSNSTLLRLSCGVDDLTVNNIYGLFCSGFLQGVSSAIQCFCYALILKACICNTKPDVKSKALNTCLAQLITFVIYELLTGFTVISYRFENIPVNAQKISGLLIYTVLPVVNPILYGFKTKDIRNCFYMVLKKHKVVSM